VIRPLALFLALLIGGCTGHPSLSCTSAPKAAPIDDNERATSIVGVVYARKLRRLALDANFGSGFGAKTMSNIAGTDAYSVRHSAVQLRQMMASARAVDFWLETQGDITLPRKSAKTCEMLADSIASLDVGQSDDQFVENIGAVEAYFMARFKRFGGKDLEGRIAELD
jgi:hypothetical protein